MVDVAVWVLYQGCEKNILVRETHLTYEIGILVTETRSLGTRD